MSEQIRDSESRKKALKRLILLLHEGESPEEIKAELTNLMGKIPHGEIVEVEQELISEGLPEEEIVKLCDIHSKVIEGQIDHSQDKEVPPGHPVDTFKKENTELKKVTNELNKLFGESENLKKEDVRNYLLKLRSNFNLLMDVEKHYQREENLLFPFLEKKGVTGPPKVLWEKHDEIRSLLKSSIEASALKEEIEPDEIQTAINMLFKPAVDGVDDMIMKEEEILLPMSLDNLSDSEWYEIYVQTPEIGFCLYDPEEDWKPEGVEVEKFEPEEAGKIRFKTGSLSREELEAIVNTMPVDLTYVDKDDKVQFFSSGGERIFPRNRAVLKRDVRMCHPPSSVHKVDKILRDFKSGKASRAPFWINLHGKFVHIEYFAIRDKDGEYLGTLEVTQDLTEHRQLEGEQRLLSYKK